jgi:hypothetical protein
MLTHVAVAARRCDSLLGRLKEAPAVRQSCQRIVIGHVLQLRVHRAQRFGRRRQGLRAIGHLAFELAAPTRHPHAS